MDNSGIGPESSSPFFQKDKTRFAMGIQGLVAKTNEKAAQIEALTRISPRKLDDQKNRAALWGNFYSFLWQLVENSRHVIKNESLISRMDFWLSSYSYIGEQRTNVLKQGILLSREWQKELKDLGIIDLNTSEEFTTFPFKYYLNMVALTRIQNRKIFMQNKEDTHPDETDPENLGRPAPLNSIIGFSGNGAFGSMYFMVYSTLNRLLSAGLQEEAISYFYTNLGNFASVFDLTFLTNCIKIEHDVLGTEGIEPSSVPLMQSIPEGDDATKEIEKAVTSSMKEDVKLFASMPSLQKKNTVFQLQLSELAWLMKRANITPNPDVMQIGITDLNTPHYPGEVTKITGRE